MQSAPPSRAPGKSLPPHLRRYVVDQAYDKYTPRDHAVWRHVLRRLRMHLETRAHPVYLRGLEKTGIDSEAIPRLSEMNEKLSRLGWSCVAVRGFIPPPVFTELQSLRVLAIAADIRSHKTLLYTPAPDILHESAGHAPIIADADYASYLQACGEVGFKAIDSAEDRALFEAIRNVSVVKEDPHATEGDIAHAEFRLEAAARSVRYFSESTMASRLYWWTAEYGLIGSIERPRLYGAGLLSSISEGEHCLSDAVQKVPLTEECVHAAFDITKMQPRLFVARDFAHLAEVLNTFKATLAWVRGGDYGLEEALRSHTVNHLVLKQSDGSQVEVTGELRALHRATQATRRGLTVAVVEIAGPTMISTSYKCVEKPKRINAIILVGAARLPARGHFSFRLASGVHASGYVVAGHEVVDFHLWLHGERLEVPTWVYALVAEDIPSVAGRAADPGEWDAYFGPLETFQAGSSEEVARQHKADALPPPLATLYAEVRKFRGSTTRDSAVLAHLAAEASAFPDEMLLQEEIAELGAASRRS